MKKIGIKYIKLIIYIKLLFKLNHKNNITILFNTHSEFFILIIFKFIFNILLERVFFTIFI